MKVWLLHMDSYGEVDVFSEDTDVLEIPFVKEELSYLDGAYEDERDDFIAEIERIKKRGSGDAAIEARFVIELTEVSGS